MNFPFGNSNNYSHTYGSYNNSYKNPKSNDTVTNNVASNIQNNNINNRNYMRSRGRDSSNHNNHNHNHNHKHNQNQNQNQNTSSTNNNITNNNTKNNNTKNNNTTNNNTTNKRESVSISPVLWGPFMWNLLHEIAKYGSHGDNSDEIEKFIQDFKNIIRALPYILPCQTCRQHTSQAYTGDKIQKTIKSCKDFKSWVWKMKSIANGNTGATSINFEQYSNRLLTWSEFISEKHVVDLLFMIAYSFPLNRETDSHRQQYYLLFFKSIANICGKIEHLANINKLNDEIDKLDANGKWTSSKDVLNFINGFHETLYGAQCAHEKFIA